MTIYAVRDPETRAVKFGYTRHRKPGRRVSSLQLSNPRDLVVEWYGPGTREDERGLHGILAPAKARGEWFNDHYLVKLALYVLPISGAHALVESGRETLCRFQPLSGPFVRAWTLPGFHKGSRRVYWPRWCPNPAGADA